MENQDQNKFQLRLKKKLEIDGKFIEFLDLREPTAGELDFAEQNSKGANGSTIQIIALVSGLHSSVIKQLGARDYTEAAKYIKSFLDSDL